MDGRRVGGPEGVMRTGNNYSGARRFYSARRSHEDRSGTMTSGETKLGLIGRDYVLIKKLAEQVRASMRREYEHTALHETADMRGQWFEVRMVDGYVARISVVLDRIEPQATEERR